MKSGRVIPFLCLLLAFTQLLHADWLLVDDMESYGYDDPIPFAEKNSIIYTWQIVDPEDPENYAAWFDYNFPHEILSWINIPLPEELPIDRTSTIFMRIYKTGPYTEMWLATSKIASPEAGDSELSPALDEMAAYLRDSYDGVNNYYVAWDKKTQRSNPRYHPNFNEWTNVWMVLDNRYNGSGEFIGGVEFYVQGSSDPLPRLLTWSEQKVGKMPFRDKRKDTIKTITVGMEMLMIDPMYLDDLYMATEPCLSNPTLGEPCASWCGFSVANGDYASTGDWLGWIWTGLCASPPGWVYSLKYDRWLWIDSCPPEGERSWVYLPMGKVKMG